MLGRSGRLGSARSTVLARSLFPLVGPAFTLLEDANSLERVEGQYGDEKRIRGAKTLAMARSTHLRSPAPPNKPD